MDEKQKNLQSQTPFVKTHSNQNERKQSKLLHFAENFHLKKELLPILAVFYDNSYSIPL